MTNTDKLKTSRCTLKSVFVSRGKRLNIFILHHIHNEQTRLLCKTKQKRKGWALAGKNLRSRLAVLLVHA